MDTKRRKALKAVDKHVLNSKVEAVNTNLIKEIDHARIKWVEGEVSINESDYDIREFNHEIELIINDFKKNFHEKQLELLLNTSRNEVLGAIVKPFGIAGVIFKDKIGGNVTTVHNAQKRIYASEEDQYNRKDYTASKNSEGNQFEGTSRRSVGSEYTKSQMDVNGNVIDAYTNQKEKAKDTSPDHAYSLSEYHKNGGFMQDETSKANFATDTENLFLTKRSINQSMRDTDKKDWAQKEHAESNASNAEYYSIDERALQEAYEKGQRTAQKHLPSDIEKTMYYTKNIAISGMNEAAKMGLQQALGLVILELVDGLYLEIIDIFKNGFKTNDDSFFKTIKVRFDRVASRVMNKRKEIAISFGHGALSGFISNMITTIINMIYTTSAKVVRAIREGVFSLFKALKVIINPPSGMSVKETYHEAMKLIASGAILSMGLFLDEVIEKLIIATPIIGPILAPMAKTVSNVIAGILTGITSALIVYMIDKIDLLHVNRDTINKKLIEILDTMIDDTIKNINDKYGHLTTVEVY